MIEGRKWMMKHNHALGFNLFFF